MTDRSEYLKQYEENRKTDPKRILYNIERSKYKHQQKQEKGIIKKCSFKQNTLLNSLSFDELEDVYNRICPIEQTSICIECSNGHCKGRPIIALKSTSIPIAKIELCANGSFPNETDTISHLCHNKKCINPSHLVWESMQINLSRNVCLGECLHLPKCIIQRQIN